jgi:hypothetical protein
VRRPTWYEPARLGHRRGPAELAGEEVGLVLVAAERHRVAAGVVPPRHDPWVQRGLGVDLQPVSGQRRRVQRPTTAK